MQKLSILFFFFFSLSVFGQKTTLSIMGKADYVVYADAYSLALTFEEDPSKCDPVVGFVSLEDQIKHFTESLNAKNLAMQFKEQDGIIASEYPAKGYKLSVRKIEDLQEAILLAKEQRVEVQKVFYKYPEHDFVGEDAKAINALKDAQLKAELYASHIGKKVTRILHIDDDTPLETSNPFEIGTEKYERYADVMAQLQGYSGLYKTESSSPKREGSYGLWVEFELDDK